jgi:hypothetical protein
MTDYSELVERMRAYPANKLCIQIADALEAQAKRIAGFVEMFDKMVGTPCEQVRHGHEVEQLRVRIAELEAALKPFATIPTHGEYGGPMVQARVYYECETDERAGKTYIGRRSFDAARAALKGEKG